MTKEQIAELRGKGLLDSDQLWDAVDTLLDERGALLEATKAFADLLERPGLDASTRDALENLHAAIAKAEAP